MPDLVPKAAPAGLDHHAARPRKATASSSATCRAEGILIRSATGAKISITDDGITIDNGKRAVITLKANEVDVNNGALSVE